MHIKFKCTLCGGTGELTVVDEHGEFSIITCGDCDGSGLIDWGDVADIVDKLDDIKEKCDEIMNKLNES